MCRTDAELSTSYAFFVEKSNAVRSSTSIPKIDEESDEDRDMPMEEDSDEYRPAEDSSSDSSDDGDSDSSDSDSDAVSNVREEEEEDEIENNQENRDPADHAAAARNRKKISRKNLMVSFSALASS